VLRFRSASQAAHWPGGLAWLVMCQCRGVLCWVACMVAPFPERTDGHRGLSRWPSVGGPLGSRARGADLCGAAAGGAARGVLRRARCGP
jgi:hypothetical protein